MRAIGERDRGHAASAGNGRPSAGRQPNAGGDEGRGCAYTSAIRRYGPLVVTLLVISCSDDSSPLNVVPTFVEYQELFGFDQVGTVGEPLPAPLSVLVTDEYGNPVPDASVEFELLDEDAGSITSSGALTDLDGRVTATWTLGTLAGEYSGTAYVENLGATSFNVTAEPGPPDSIGRYGGAQAAPAGTPVADPLRIEILDRYDNPIRDLPVEWDLISGDATVDSAAAATDSLGRAHAWLTVGTTPGENIVAARVDTLPRTDFPVTTGEAMNLVVDAFYLTQSTQTYDSAVPLVAGRDALLRVFALADAANAAETDVRVELYDGGTLLDTEVIPAPSPSIPTAADESVLAGTWNVTVPGELVVPDLSVRVEVDPDDGVFESDDGDNTLPASGTPLALDVRSLPAFEVRLVPVHVPATGVTGDVTDANLDDYLVDARRVFPMPGYDADLHAPFSTSVSGTETRQDWQTVLSEIDALRVAEGSSRYYYGVISSEGGTPACGLGYLGWPAAIGLDVCGGPTAAHEWGHNFDRRHAPCGGAGNVDPDYPYADASIGAYGYDVATGEVKTPTDHVDLMSYCSPAWISDYTYENVLVFRENEAAAAADARVQPTLLVWGRTGPDGLTLEPTIRIDTRPVLPTEPGPYTVTGVDAAGATLFELSFDAVPVADGIDGAGHFAFAVPAAMAQPQRLARVRLAGPGGPPVRIERPSARADIRADPAVERVGARRRRIRWNADAYPLVVLRDARTGEVLGFGRDGSTVVRTDARELELFFADGLRTARERVLLRP